MRQSARNVSAVNHDLPSQTLKVSAVKNKDGSCFVGAKLKLGPSNQDQNIRVESFYADADLVGNISKVQIIGTNEKGEPVTAEYPGAH